MKLYQKIIVILLTAAMLCGVLALTVNATVEEYGVWIGETKVTSRNYDDLSDAVTGDNAKAYYDPVNKVLTLENVEGIKGLYNDGVGIFYYQIFSEKDISINLVGESELSDKYFNEYFNISTSSTSRYDERLVVICCAQQLRIFGDGKLTISMDNSDRAVYAIEANTFELNNSLGGKNDACVNIVLGETHNEDVALRANFTCYIYGGKLTIEKKNPVVNNYNTVSDDHKLRCFIDVGDDMIIMNAVVDLNIEGYQVNEMVRSGGIIHVGNRLQVGTNSSLTVRTNNGNGKHKTATNAISANNFTLAGGSVTVDASDCQRGIAVNRFFYVYSGQGDIIAREIGIWAGESAKFESGLVKSHGDVKAIHCAREQSGESKTGIFVEGNAHIQLPAQGYADTVGSTSTIVYLNEKLEKQIAADVIIAPIVSAYLSKNGGEETELFVHTSDWWDFEVPVGETYQLRLKSNIRGSKISLSGVSYENGVLSYSDKASEEVFITFSPKELAREHYGSENQVEVKIYFEDLNFASVMFTAVKGILNLDVPDFAVVKGRDFSIEFSLTNSAGHKVRMDDGRFLCNDKMFYMDNSDDSIKIPGILDGKFYYYLSGDIIIAQRFSGSVGNDAVSGKYEVEMVCDAAGDYHNTVCTFTVTVENCPCEAGWKLEHIDAVDATCVTDGNVEYWHCDGCGKIFSDAEGENEVTDQSKIVIPAHGHSFKGMIADEQHLASDATCVTPAQYYYYCTYCGLSTGTASYIYETVDGIEPGSLDTVKIDGIEFYVLAKKDGKALLLSKYVLEPGTAFSEVNSSYWYTNCDVREYLNGEWLEKMATLQKITTPTLINTYDGEGDVVPTRDYVFLLSEADIFGNGAHVSFPSNPNIMSEYPDCLFTYYCDGYPLPAPGGSWMATDEDGKKAFWWTRSDGDGGFVVVLLEGNEVITPSAKNKSYVNFFSVAYEEWDLGIRPAMWIEYKPQTEWQKEIEEITPVYDLPESSAPVPETVEIDGVEFYVMAKRRSNGAALLLSKYVLKTGTFFDEFSNRWHGSEIEEYLNGEWLDEIPTLKAAAQETVIQTYFTGDCDETKNKVFLLSQVDVSGEMDGSYVLGSPEYTYDSKLKAPDGSWATTDEDGRRAAWWLRSQGPGEGLVFSVHTDGSLELYNSDHAKIDQIIGIRPAMWVKYTTSLPLQESETFNHGDALGHDWGDPYEDDIVFDDDWMPIGVVMKRECTRCDECEEAYADLVCDDKIVYKCDENVTYTFVAVFDEEQPFTCDYSYNYIAYAIGHAEKLEYVRAVSETCTKNGMKAHYRCPDCGKLFRKDWHDYWNDIVGLDKIEYYENEITNKSELIIPADHLYILNKAKAPTCTEIGWRAYETCWRCDHSTYVERKALGHDIVLCDEIAPTCTESGCTAYETCSRCDYATACTEIEATGHDFGEWYVVKEPTDSEEGTSKRDCSNCDHFETKTLGALDVYKIEIPENEHGDIEIIPSDPAGGDPVIIRVTPHEGYELDVIKVTGKDGSEITVTPNEDGTYTFTMPEGDVEIDASFKEVKNDPPVVVPPGENEKPSPLFLIILICVLAIGTMLVIILSKKRKDKENSEESSEESK